MRHIIIASVILITLGAQVVQAGDDASLCRETALDYAHYADTGQTEKFGELFTYDGVLVTSNGSRKPRQEKPQSDRPPRTTRHVATNHRVREENGALIGTSYFTFYFSSEASDPALPIADQPVAVGTYHDKYVIEDGQCKFIERTAKVTFANPP